MYQASNARQTAMSATPKTTPNLMPCGLASVPPSNASGLSRLSPLNGDHVCLHLAVHTAAPETPPDGFRSDVGCFPEPLRAVRLDLVSQRCPLAKGYRRIPRGFCAATRRDRDDLGCPMEATGDEILLDACKLVIAVGCPCEKAGWILGKHASECLRHRICEFIFLEPIPNIEDENSAPTEHSACLRKRLDLFGKKHDPELAYNGVERSV